MKAGPVEPASAAEICKSHNKSHQLFKASFMAVSSHLLIPKALNGMLEVASSILVSSTNMIIEVTLP
jgi:hypothetical protein